jgi:hypothetical protein
MSSLMKAIGMIAAVLLGGTDAGEKEWDSWTPLLGEWTAEGGGKPGQGTGEFSFQIELQGKVLVRKNRSDYPASQGRPASTHEDLMIFYRELGGRTRANYFDSEGHVIHYECDESQAKKWSCTSVGTTPPAFRLTYTLPEPGTLNIKFEISRSGKPDGFQTYLSGVARQRSRGK